MLRVSSMVSKTFSSICPGTMPKSLRLMVKVERIETETRPAHALERKQASRFPAGLPC
jgi:hypothetical protein